MIPTPSAPVRVVPVRTADTLRWVRPDLATRLLPFAAALALAWLVWRPRWLGLSAGDLGLQLAFGVVGAPLLFVLAMAVQRTLSRRRGALGVPVGNDVWIEAGYYVLNGPLEEGFFRGLLQGGLGAAFGPIAGLLVGTSAYVLYHRLGRWGWPEVAATALLGVPLALAFWLLPGPPSLLGVSIAHVGATCGFLGPGPYLLKRLRLV